MLEAAKGRKHRILAGYNFKLNAGPSKHCNLDRALLQRLFEDWLQSGESWANSSIVTNHRSRVGQKKRGKDVYMTFRDMKEKFGASAKTIRDTKYHLEANRDPSDKSPAYWRAHPELPDDKDSNTVLFCNVDNFPFAQEWELFRVWDSAELVSTEEEETEHHFQHHADLTAQQTGMIMFPVAHWCFLLLPISGFEMTSYDQLFGKIATVDLYIIYVRCKNYEEKSGPCSGQIFSQLVVASRPFPPVLPEVLSQVFLRIQILGREGSRLTQSRNPSQRSQQKNNQVCQRSLLEKFLPLPVRWWRWNAWRHSLTSPPCH